MSWAQLLRPHQKAVFLLGAQRPAQLQGPSVREAGAHVPELARTHPRRQATSHLNKQCDCWSLRHACPAISLLSGNSRRPQPGHGHPGHVPERHVPVTDKRAGGDRHRCCGRRTRGPAVEMQGAPRTRRQPSRLRGDLPLLVRGKSSALLTRSCAEAGRLSTARVARHPSVEKETAVLGVAEARSLEHGIL